MYVAPKTDFIYIPKYTDTSGWERALELSRDTVKKLDRALDSANHALDLAGSARDHNFAISKLNKNTLFALAAKYNIPESEVKKIKKDELIKLPEDLKKDIDPNVIEAFLKDCE